MTEQQALFWLVILMAIFVGTICFCIITITVWFRSYFFDLIELAKKAVKE